jgi:predicted Zn-dependent protease
VPANQLNVRLLLRTAVVVLLLGAALFVVHGWQVGRLARAELARADRAERAGQLDQATTALGRSLAFVPDEEVRARYALALAGRASTPRTRWAALEVLERALARRPARHDVRRRAVDLTMQLGQFERARRHLAVLLAAQPGAGDLLLLRGRCESAEGDHARAALSLEQAIRQGAPLEASVLLADLYRTHLDRPRKGAAVMDLLVKEHGRSAAAHLARARFRAAGGDLTRAEDDLARARRLAPRDLAVLEASADVAVRRGRLEEARGHWTAALRAAPRTARLYLALARLERRRGQEAAALDYLRRGLRQLPDEPDLLFALAEALLEQRDLAGAEKAAGRLPPERRPAARFLAGRVLARRGRWAAAVRALTETVEAQDVPADLAARAQVELACCWDRLGYDDQKLAAYLRAAAGAPSLVAARLGLGVLLLEGGLLDDAVSHLQALVRLPDAPAQGWLLLARARARQNLYLPATQRDWTDVERALERAAQSPKRQQGDRLHPLSSFSPASSLRHPAGLAVVRAEVLAARDDLAAAREVLVEARRRWPDQLAVYQALAELALRRGDAAAADAALTQAGRRLGDTIDWWLARLELAERRGDVDLAVRLADLENALGRFPADAQERLLRRLARFQARLGNAAAVERLCDRLLRRQPGDLRVHLLRLDAAVAAGEDEVIARALAALRRAEGRAGTTWRCASAGWHIARACRGDRTGLAEARRLLAEVTRRRPAWARAALLQAQLDELEQRTEQALAGYVRAVVLGERQPGTALRATELLVQRGKYAVADRLLHQAQQRGALGAGHARLLAEVAVRARNLERALLLARQAVPEQATDPRALVWQGGLLGRLGQDSQAETALRRAVTLAGYDPETWLALIGQLARTGKAMQAEELLDEMHLALPPERQTLALARAHEALNRHDRAEQEYRRAVAARPHDPEVLQRAAAFHVRLDQPDRAAVALRALLRPRTLTPAAVLPGVRRQLALVLTASGSHVEEALELLAQNRREGSARLLDRRLRALVQGARAGQRVEALRTLEGLPGGTTALAAEERLRLARLYETAGQWEKAEGQWRLLLEADGANPAYLAGYVGGLMRQGKQAAARRWLVRLEQVEPAAARTWSLRRQLPERGSRR